MVDATEGLRGRNPRQAAQHAATRQRLIGAGVRVFSAKGVAGAVVADVLNEAQVSRASFYAHFDSMRMLVEAIADDFAPSWQPVYGRLATILDADVEVLRAWCAQMIAVYHQNEDLCVILAQAEMIESALYWKIAAYREMLIDLISDGHPGFAHLQDDPNARLRTALALSQLDHACYFLAVRRWPADPAAGLDVMAAQLHFFLQAERERGRAR